MAAAADAPVAGSHRECRLDFVATVTGSLLAVAEACPAIVTSVFLQPVQAAAAALPQVGQEGEEGRMWQALQHGQCAHHLQMWLHCLAIESLLLSCWLPVAIRSALLMHCRLMSVLQGPNHLDLANLLDWLVDSCAAQPRLACSLASTGLLAMALECAGHLATCGGAGEGWSACLLQCEAQGTGERCPPQWLAGLSLPQAALQGLPRLQPE